MLKKLPMLFYMNSLLKTFKEKNKNLKQKRSLILIIMTYITWYKFFIENLLKTRKPFKIKEIPNSYYDEGYLG